MRRYVRSYALSFVKGLLIASGTAASLVAVHHVLAPPAPETIAAPGSVHEKAPVAAAPVLPVASPPIKIQAAHEPAAGLGPMPVAAKPVRPAKTGAGEAQRSLTRNIQNELARVGCYKGAADGTWSPETRAAMAAFNDSVQVRLPLNRPDYILLTLLQGHAAKACRPASPEITAQRPAPKSSARRIAKTEREPNWRTAAAPVPQPPALPTAPATPDTVAIAPQPAPPPLPLPGRMAVGVPLPPAGIPIIERQTTLTAVPAAPPVALPQAQSPVAPLRDRDTGPQITRQPAALSAVPRPAPHQREARPRRSPRPAGPSGGTFFQLSRNAP